MGRTEKATIAAGFGIEAVGMSLFALLPNPPLILLTIVMVIGALLIAYAVVQYGEALIDRTPKRMKAFVRESVMKGGWAVRDIVDQSVCPPASLWTLEVDYQRFTVLISRRKNDLKFFAAWFLPEKHRVSVQGLEKDKLSEVMEDLNTQLLLLGIQYDSTRAPYQLMFFNTLPVNEVTERALQPALLLMRRGMAIGDEMLKRTLHLSGSRPPASEAEAMLDVTPESTPDSAEPPRQQEP
jgi:xanthosine utilization system XapX-like protein